MGAGLPRAPTDASERKRGERSGLETPVVHALIDRKWRCAQACVSLLTQNFLA